MTPVQIANFRRVMATWIAPERARSMTDSEVVEARDAVQEGIDMAAEDEELRLPTEADRVRKMAIRRKVRR